MCRRVREYARTLPHVVHVEDNLFTCSQDTQVRMGEVMKEKGINRMVVAACTRLPMKLCSAKHCLKWD